MNRWLRYLAILLIVGPMLYAAVQRIELIDNQEYADLNGPNDPDPWLRLVIVRDWLGGGDWFSHAVTRTNAPIGGITSPWTRPLDLAIAALVKLQPGDASLSTKLMRAAALLPALWMGLLLLGLQRGVKWLYDDPISYFAIVALVAATPAIWSYFGEGNSDHHSLLAALWAWSLSLAIRPDPSPRHSTALGLLLALMLWISPEALLLIAIVYLWPVLVWLKNGRSLQPMVHLTTATAAGTLLALVVERPPHEWLHPIYDSISVVHVLLLALCAAGMRVLVALPAERLRLRKHMLLACGIIGGVILGVMYGIYPKFFHGPMAEADPYIFTHFLPRINEAHPLFSKSTMFIEGVLLLPLTAILCYVHMLRTPSPVVARGTAAQMLYLLLATLAMACSQLRWHYYQFPTTSLALAPLLAATFAGTDSWPARLFTGSELKQAAMRLALFALLLGGPYEFIQLSPGSASNPVTAACNDDLRDAVRSGALERALGEQPLILYAPTNIGGEIQFFTPYRIIGSNYHREAQGIRYLWDAANLAKPADITAYMRQRQVDAIALCSEDTALYKSLTHHGWGKPVTVDGDPALTLWRRAR